jgi:arabinan endo-1,5-alpha-L-arabinosidase
MVINKDIGMIRKHLVFSIFFVATFCAAIAQPDTLNPLKGDIRVHDPVMIKEGGTYYVFQTGLGIGVKTSRDRINWKRDSSVFSRNHIPAWFKNDIPDQKGDVWAPDIHYGDGKYQLYYSVSAWMNFNSSVGYATNITLDRNDPRYKWEDQGQVISYKNGGAGVNVIDPNVFVDNDKKVWLFFGSYQKGLLMV